MEQRNVWSCILSETHVLPILDAVLLLQQPYYFWKQSSFPLIIESNSNICTINAIKEVIWSTELLSGTLLSSRLLYKLTRILKNNRDKISLTNYKENENLCSSRIVSIYWTNKMIYICIYILFINRYQWR